MIRIPLHSFVSALLLAAVMVTVSARAAENIRLACVGDSITEGWADYRGERNAGYADFGSFTYHYDLPTTR